MEIIHGDEIIELPKNLEIPTIEDKRLLELYKLIQPVVTILEVKFSLKNKFSTQIQDSKYCLKNFSLEQLKHFIYIYNSKLLTTDEIDLSKLEFIADYFCLHKIDYTGIFKPLISDVLSQMPENLIGTVNAFEIIKGPIYGELPECSELSSKGFHLSKVRTYKINR